MLNPNSLRKKTEEAAERLERERLLEEERLRQEIEAKRLAEERRRLEEINRAKLRRQVLQSAAAAIRQAIKAASMGQRNTTIDAPPEVADDLCAELGHRNLVCSVSETNKWTLTLRKRLNKLAEKLGGDVLGGNARATFHMGRLLYAELPDDPNEMKEYRSYMLHLTDEFRSDPEYLLPEDALTYLNLNLKPHLDSDAFDEPVAQVKVAWTPMDVADGVMTHLHEVPSWLLSTGGSGLMQRIDQCLALDADRGKCESLFTLVELPMNPVRWGQNTMMKFMHGDQPVGVCPFPPEVFAQAVEAMGFKVVRTKGDGMQSLSIRW